MKLHDELIVYEQVTVSDGAGGKAPGDLTEVTRLWGAVKPLSGMMAMTFQQTYGTQGFEVIIRTDFLFAPDRTYMIEYKGIYGNQIFSIAYPIIDKHYTKLICKSENKYPLKFVFLIDDDGAFITNIAGNFIILN